MFLIAIIAPGALLVALSLRLIAQDTELADKRAQDSRRLAAARMAQQLTTRLEQLKLQALAIGAAWNPQRNHAIALITTAEGERLVLPWDAAVERARFRAEIVASPFAEAFAAADRDEVVTRDRTAAHTAYGAALDIARSPEQRAAAEIALLRTSPVADDFGRVASSLLRSTVVDEEGVPVSLYAVRMLLGRGGGVAVPDIVNALRSTLDRVPMNLFALHMIRELAAAPELDRSDVATAVSALRADTQMRLGAAQQAHELQRSFAGILARTDGRDPAWVPFGPNDDAWLVTVTRPPVTPEVRAVVVRAAAVATDVELASRQDDGSEPLGAGFPGLFVTLPAESSGSRESIRTELFAVVALTLTITLSASWFFWRDVQRDLRMADLRSQFVASVSHELKTPLTAIRMFAETLRLGRTPSNRTAEYLDTIVSESERLTRLMNNVLDFSRVEQGTRRYRLTAQALAPIVRSAARTLRYPLEQAAFEMHLVIEDEGLEALCDADGLEQAILNLLSNAMKYSGASRFIELRLMPVQAGAAIVVSDRGIGIPTAEQARIFEKFYRGSADAHQRVAGTGLGLTLVRHTIRAHGGTISVASAPGHGSAFTIVLPAIAPNGLAATAVPPGVARDAAPSVLES